MTVEIKEGTYYYIEFSDEQLEKLGLSVGDKLSVEETENGLLLVPYETMELDLDEMPTEVLQLLIQQSVEKDISVNDVLTEMLTSALNINNEK
jgi:bifunctional DNA-binding transcriptional regulator/antitoxin component of YhaV-PrlF toxin-antitoxin module